MDDPRLDGQEVVHAAEAILIEARLDQLVASFDEELRILGIVFRDVSTKIADFVRASDAVEIREVGGEQM